MITQEVNAFDSMVSYLILRSGLLNHSKRSKMKKMVGEIMEDNAMNSNCCQYKLGLQVSNKGVVIMAGKLETQMKREIAIMTEAKDWFKKYVMA